MPRYLLPVLVAFPVAVILAATEDVSAFRARGDLLYRSFDNSGALAQYQQAYNLSPDDFETLVRMARIHNDIGRSMLRTNDSAEVWYTRAVEYAQRLVQLYPDSSESHFWLAVTYGSLVPFRGISEKLAIGKAVTRYARESIELDSTFSPSYIVLGIICREGARLKWYERLIANTIFGGALPGTIEDSENMFLKAIQLNPESIFAYFELSRTYGQMGNEEKRKECLEKVLTFAPGSLREKEEQQRAQRMLERLREPRPQ